MSGGKLLEMDGGKLCAQVEKRLKNKEYTDVEKGVDNVNNYL